MTAAPSDPQAVQRLALARQIAEGSQLLGAEGVFWRLCGLYAPVQLGAFAADEARRGTGGEQMMEGASVHIARQITALAHQTDLPQEVGLLLLEAIGRQVMMELAPPPVRLPGLHYPMGGRPE